MNKNKRIELRFGLTAPGSMWNLLYEGMEQNINLRTTFKGKDEESIDALIKFGEILKKLTNTPVVYVEPPKYTKQVDVGNFLVDNSKLCSLGWKPKISLESGIRKTLEYFHTIK